MSSPTAIRGDGKRAWKELANGTRSYFYYAGEQMIASTNGTDSSSLQLWGADGLIGTRNVNAGVVSKRYNLYDTQGNLAQTVTAPCLGKAPSPRGASRCAMRRAK